mmetsp:Transcript_53272/g.133740  ORF Transcript_53272/g.133740 Transcript_53272/m.133740 type:complete len:215 (+) Transcript_53272:1326-1970(+)
MISRGLTTGEEAASAPASGFVAAAASVLSGVRAACPSLFASGGTAASLLLPAALSASALGLFSGAFSAALGLLLATRGLLSPAPVPFASIVFTTRAGSVFMHSFIWWNHTSLERVLGDLKQYCHPNTSMSKIVFFSYLSSCFAGLSMDTNCSGTKRSRMRLLSCGVVTSRLSLKRTRCINPCSPALSLIRVRVSSCTMWRLLSSITFNRPISLL